MPGLKPKHSVLIVRQIKKNILNDFFYGILLYMIYCFFLIIIKKN